LGTLWVISHEEAIHFDSGDARVMTELAAFQYALGPRCGR
jgi:hypothetical protein